MSKSENMCVKIKQDDSINQKTENYEAVRFII